LGTSDGMGAQVPAKDRPLSGNPTLLEEEAVAKAEAGELFDRGEGPFDLTEMQKWGEEPTVRAAVLENLLVAHHFPIHAKGVRLRRVRISGHLDLEAASLRCPLSLEYCYLDTDEPVCLDYATASHVTLTGCQLPGLRGKMLTANELDLSGSTLRGPLVLVNANIATQLVCSGAHLNRTDSDGNALAADRLKVSGDVYLDSGFTAAGTVRLAGAEIAGRLDCRGAHLNGYSSDIDSADSSDALAAAGMKVGGNVYFDGGFATAGTVRLTGADITGRLECRGAQLKCRDQPGYAMYARGVRVGGDVLLCGNFTAAGAVRLTGADIAGRLRCSGARLTGQDQAGNGLLADKVKVGGDVLLDGGFTADGAVRLTGRTSPGRSGAGARS
jgi:hypothetical protein